MVFPIIMNGQQSPLTLLHLPHHPQSNIQPSPLTLPIPTPMDGMATKSKLIKVEKLPLFLGVLSVQEQSIPQLSPLSWARKLLLEFLPLQLTHMKFDLKSLMLREHWFVRGLMDTHMILR